MRIRPSATKDKARNTPSNPAISMMKAFNTVKIITTPEAMRRACFRRQTPKASKAMPKASQIALIVQSSRAPKLTDQTFIFAPLKMKPVSYTHLTLPTIYPV